MTIHAMIAKMSCSSPHWANRWTRLSPASPSISIPAMLLAPPSGGEDVDQAARSDQHREGHGEPERALRALVTLLRRCQQISKITHRSSRYYCICTVLVAAVLGDRHHDAVRCRASPVFDPRSRDLTLATRRPTAVRALMIEALRLESCRSGLLIE